MVHFHQREQKPDWWAFFQRQEMMEEEVIEDGECIGSLVMDSATAPFKEKNSQVYTFDYPPQEHKMKVGSQVLDSKGENIGSI